MDMSSLGLCGVAVLKLKAEEEAHRAAGSPRTGTRSAPNSARRKAPSGARRSRWRRAGTLRRPGEEAGGHRARWIGGIADSDHRDPSRLSRRVDRSKRRRAAPPWTGPGPECPRVCWIRRGPPEGPCCVCQGPCCGARRVLCQSVLTACRGQQIGPHVRQLRAVP